MKRRLFYEGATNPKEARKAAALQVYSESEAPPLKNLNGGIPRMARDQGIDKVWGAGDSVPCWGLGQRPATSIVA